MEKGEARLPTGNVTRAELLERALDQSGLSELGVEPDDLRVFVGEAEVGAETMGLRHKDGAVFALMVEVPSHPGAVYVPSPGRWLLMRVADIPIPEEASDEG